jgi:hypothetical protein
MPQRRPAPAALLVVWSVSGGRPDRDAGLGVPGREIGGGTRGNPERVSAFSESGDRPPSHEHPPAEPDEPLGTAAQRRATEQGPEASAREARQRERESRRRERPQGMVPGRERRRSKVERGAMRVVATGGIIGIAVVLGAVLVGQDVAGWIVGLAVGLTSVILAALLWSSRQL